MKHVTDLFERLVQGGSVRGIRRFNLRKYCRSFGAPPCGVSFWDVEDLSWETLERLNSDGRSMNERIWLCGGESFPRAFWDAVVLGQERRTEFVFLRRYPGCGRHHRDWLTFFEKGFGEHAKTFGHWSASKDDDAASLIPFFRNQLQLDLIEFAYQEQHLVNMALFTVGLALLDALSLPPREPTAETLFAQAARFLPDQRDLLMRLGQDAPLTERLNDCLDLMDVLRGTV